MGKGRKKTDRSKAKKKTKSGSKGAKVRPISPKVAIAGSTPQAVEGPKGWWLKTQSFLKEVRVEFDKVTWPTRKETLALTMAVLALTFFFTAYLGLVDITLSKLVSFLIY